VILIPTELQAPLLIILSGIALCLIFETAGLKEGFRRHGNKSYISLIAFVTVIFVFLAVFRSEKVETVSLSGLIFDHLSRSAILALSLLCFGVLWITVERLRPTNADRGEIYALILFVFLCNILVCCATSHLLFACAFIASLSAQVAIIANRKRRRSSPEIALKIILSSFFALLLLAAVFAFESANQPLAVIVCLISFVLFFAGAVPLQSLHVDVLDGAPSYSAALYASSTLLITPIVLARLASNPSLTPQAGAMISNILLALGGATLCLAPIMALDQRRLSRVLAYLLCSQTGIALIIASLMFIHVPIPVYLNGFLFTHFVLCTVGTYSGQNLWKKAGFAFKTWEDFAGAGRQHPIEAGAFFIVLASIIGLPFTSGFILRHALVTLAPPHLRLTLLLIMLFSVSASVVPTYRLFAFFFGKTVRHELRKHHNTRRKKILLLGVCATFAIACSLAPISVLSMVFDLGQQ
jgi:NADH-quinone oxidoreductase subunit N